MTTTEHQPTEQQIPPGLPGTPPTDPAQAAFEPCDECQAPLDERQRYCVVCGTHRPNADDPVARYLAESRRSRNTPPPAPAPPRSAGGARLALAIALVPLAAALGVLVGRGDAGGDQQLVEALKVQKAPVVNVVGGGAAVAGAAKSAADDGSASADAGASASDTSKVKGGEVLARTEYGTARKLEGAKPTATQVAESKKALKKITDSKGKEYVESQRGLPDQIVIP